MDHQTNITSGNAESHGKGCLHPVDRNAQQRQRGATVVDAIIAVRKRGLQSSLACYMRVDQLRELELFQGCSPEFVSAVIEDVGSAIFHEGETIIEEGEEADSCYILNRGEVSVEVGGKQVTTLGDGSIFGEICLLGVSSRRTASVVCLSQVCDVRVVHKKMFRRALKKFPHEAKRFEKEARRRLAELYSNRPELLATLTDQKPKGRRRSKRVAPVLAKLQRLGFDLGHGPYQSEQKSRQTGGEMESLIPMYKEEVKFLRRRRSTGTTGETRSSLPDLPSVEARSSGHDGIPIVPPIGRPGPRAPRRHSTGSYEQSSYVVSCPDLPPIDSHHELHHSSSDDDFGDSDSDSDTSHVTAVIPRYELASARRSLSKKDPMEVSPRYSSGKKDLFEVSSPRRPVDQAFASNTWLRCA